MLTDVDDDNVVVDDVDKANVAAPNCVVVIPTFDFIAVPSTATVPVPALTVFGDIVDFMITPFVVELRFKLLLLLSDVLLCGLLLHPISLFIIELSPCAIFLNQFNLYIFLN